MIMNLTSDATTGLAQTIEYIIVVIIGLHIFNKRKLKRKMNKKDISIFLSINLILLIIAYYFDDIFSIFIEPINSLTVVITSIIGKYLNLDVIQYPFAQKSLLHILPISINYYSVVLYDKTTKIVISNGTLTEDCILGFIFTNYLFFSFLYLYFKGFEAINLQNMKYFLIKYKLIIFKKIITGIILTFIFSLVRFLIILSSEWVIFSFTPFNSSSLIDIYIRFNIAHNVIANTILIPILLLFIIYLSYGLKSSNSSSIDLIR